MSPLPDGVTTQVTDTSASATAVVAAPPEAIFDFLRQPANHAVVSGDGSVRDTISGPERLGPGDKFGMKMKMGLPYRISSKVVEFEEPNRLAWCHMGGHRWRWELVDNGDGTTTVTETFDMSTAKFPPGLRVAGYPKRHEANVAGSVAKLREHFASTAG
jgi:uncharacterized protein YndB with AHSA1/START domain